MPSIVYEWDVETVSAVDTDSHEEGEVIDHYHVESYAEAMRVAALSPEPGFRHEIVLVRDDDAGRAWAYVESGTLPVHFHDASGENVARVPKRFHAEVLK